MCEIGQREKCGARGECLSLTLSFTCAYIAATLCVCVYLHAVKPKSRTQIFVQRALINSRAPHCLVILCIYISRGGAVKCYKKKNYIQKLCAILFSHLLSHDSRLCCVRHYHPHTHRLLLYFATFAKSANYKLACSGRRRPLFLLAHT